MIWIFRNGQQDRDDDRNIFVAMTSTLRLREQLSSVQKITVLGTSSRISSYHTESVTVDHCEWRVWSVKLPER